MFCAALRRRSAAFFWVGGLYPPVLIMYLASEESLLNLLQQHRTVASKCCHQSDEAGHFLLLCNPQIFGTLLMVFPHWARQDAFRPDVRHDPVPVKVKGWLGKYTQRRLMLQSWTVVGPGPSLAPTLHVECAGGKRRGVSQQLPGQDACVRPRHAHDDAAWRQVAIFACSWYLQVMCWNFKRRVIDNGMPAGPSERLPCVNALTRMPAALVCLQHNAAIGSPQLHPSPGQPCLS